MEEISLAALPSGYDSENDLEESEDENKDKGKDKDEDENENEIRKIFEDAMSDVPRVLDSLLADGSFTRDPTNQQNASWQFVSPYFISLTPKLIWPT